MSSPLPLRPRADDRGQPRRSLFLESVMNPTSQSEPSPRALERSAPRALEQSIPRALEQSTPRTLEPPILRPMGDMPTLPRPIFRSPETATSHVRDRFAESGRSEGHSIDYFGDPSYSANEREMSHYRISPRASPRSRPLYQEHTQAVPPRTASPLDRVDAPTGGTRYESLVSFGRNPSYDRTSPSERASHEATPPYDRTPPSERIPYDRPLYDRAPYEGRPYERPHYGHPQYELPHYEGPAYEHRAYEHRPYEPRAYEACAYEQPPYDHRAYEHPPPYEHHAYEHRHYERPLYERASVDHTPVERVPFSHTRSYRGSYGGGDYGRVAEPRRMSLSAGVTKPRKRRGNLPKETTDRLRGWFMSHLTHPYPTEEEKVKLMRQTGLQMNQISNWFINARRRQLPIINRSMAAERAAERAAQREGERMVELVAERAAAERAAAERAAAERAAANSGAPEAPPHK